MNDESTEQKERYVVLNENHKIGKRECYGSSILPVLYSAGSLFTEDYFRDLRKSFKLQYIKESKADSWMLNLI